MLKSPYTIDSDSYRHFWKIAFLPMNCDLLSPSGETFQIVQKILSPKAISICVIATVQGNEVLKEAVSCGSARACELF